jgi:hypothetical protein
MKHRIGSLKAGAHHLIILLFSIYNFVDRGTVRNYIVRGTKRETLADLFEEEIKRNGFQIQNRPNFHNSTMISAQTGSYYAQKSVDFMISAVLQSHVSIGTVYTTDVDIMDRGPDLEIRFAVAPILDEYESDQIFGMLDNDPFGSSGDPNSVRILENILNGIVEKGVIFEDLRSYQQLIGLKPDEKFTDSYGWTVKRSPEALKDIPVPYNYNKMALILGITGFIGFLLVGGMMPILTFSNEGSAWIFLLIGSFLSLFGFPGIFYSIAAIAKSGKGKRKKGVVALFLSILTILGMIFIFLYFIYRVAEVFSAV